MIRKYIAYTRVSTIRQSAEGVSLAEQRRAISAYALSNGLTVRTWHEEITTAAKRGRPVFDSVLQQLRHDKGQCGLIMHKIDRGARNLRDWADVGELIDSGIEVRFAHDDLDLHTRGGRLSADIQAVIAADYIRNLREEVKKGIVGRLQQGFYPFAAPLGYLDRGPGRVKAPNPATAPLVIAAFQRYATGRYSLRLLSREMAVLGLCNRSGRPFQASALSALLRSRFYIGECNVAGASYPGKHQPLVSPELFAAVQHVFKTRQRHRARRRHTFRFQHCLMCRTCGHHLLGEQQKSHVYYRCHQCQGICVREDRIGEPDHRFRILFNASPRGYGQLEPWEKFESREGLAKYDFQSSQNGSAEPPTYENTPVQRCFVWCP